MKFVSHIGIDVGSYGIKLAQVEPEAEGKFRLVSLGQAVLPAGGEKSVVLKSLLKESGAGVKQAVLSLPEAQVYTRVVEMPFMDESELASAIRWQAEQYIPVSLEEVTLRYQTLSLPQQGVPGSKMSVLLVAAPNHLVSSYVSLAQFAGLEVVAIETEILAVSRMLTLAVSTLPTTLVIHFGAASTSFAIHALGKLALVQTVSTGGDAVTRAVATEMGLEQRQAEEYKKSYGLDETKLGGRMVAAAKPAVDLILNEAKRMLAFYGSRGEVDPVKLAILSGGGATMPKIVEYCSQSLGLEVQLIDLFASLTATAQQKVAIGELGPVYAVAVGLAVKT